MPFYFFIFFLSNLHVRQESRFDRFRRTLACPAPWLKPGRAVPAKGSEVSYKEQVVRMRLLFSPLGFFLFTYSTVMTLPRLLLDVSSGVDTQVVIIL